MWDRWQVRVGTSLIAGLLFYLGWTFIIMTALSGFMGMPRPWWASILGVIGGCLIILSPSFVPICLERNFWPSLLIGILGLGIFALTIEVWNTDKLLFPIIVMTTFLTIASGNVKNARTAVALFVALLITLAIAFSSEMATNLILKYDYHLSSSFKGFLYPSSAYSLCVLFNIGAQEKLSWPTIILSIGIIIIASVVLSLIFGYGFII
jgi:hypothetical protein